MSGSVNKVILVGNVGRDPEIRSMQNGGKVAQLSVATSESWRDKSTGERQERTEWHRVVVFNEHLIDVVERFVKKGRRLYVEGSLQTRKWTDNDGAERYSTEVVLQRFKGEIQILDDKRAEEGDAREPEPPKSGGGYGSHRDPPRKAPPRGDLDDEIPL